MSSESTAQWRRAFDVTFGVLQTLMLGILVHIVNKLDRLADADTATNLRVSQVEGRVSHLEGRFDKTLAQIYTVP